MAFAMCPSVMNRSKATAPWQADGMLNGKEAVQEDKTPRTQS